MKKYSRFKQSYKAVIDDIIDENTYPSTRYHLRKQIAYAFGLGAMWEWANDVKLSSKFLHEDLKGSLK